MFICITFFCCYKTGCNLHSICTKSKCSFIICMLINPSCQNDRDFFLIFFFVFSYYGNNFFYFFSINLWSKFSYLFFMETKMSSCHRSFDHNKICCFFIFFIPEFQNNMGRFSGRYNGSDCNITIFYISRKINRKPCS